MQYPKANPVGDSSPTIHDFKYFRSLGRQLQYRVNYYKKPYTSSAVLATESNPIYAKKTVADPASIPSTPKGKYLWDKNIK